tara:strand:- start:430 stop:636 length:207 start_codon:yes stop_codon:yes gene_type:complete
VERINPPKAVVRSDIEISFPGKNLSARGPPKMYENNAAMPYIENKLPNSIFVKLKILRKVGLKTLDKK